MKQKKRIIIISFVVLIIAIVGIIIFAQSKNKNTVQTISPIQSNLELPDIIEQDIIVNIYKLDDKKDEVIFSIVSKEKEYEIYYAIVEITEGQEVDAIKDVGEEAYCVYEKDLTIDRNSIILLKYKNEEKFSNTPYKVVINDLSNKIDEEITKEDLEKAQITKTEQKNNKSTYYIKVNYGANVVTIYKKDDNGDYTVPVKAMICSCGTATPTSGVYKTTNKYVWRALIGGVHGQYATRIVGSILFHSVPYTAQKKDKLEYWEYDKLGTKASAGCVRLTVADAYWIYNNCSAGTMVEFYSSPNPGPLGKPTSQKISGYTELRNWDPTDPASDNPWKGGSGITEIPSHVKPTDTEKPSNQITSDQPTTPSNTTIQGNTTNTSNTTTGNNTNVGNITNTSNTNTTISGNTNNTTSIENTTTQSNTNSSTTGKPSVDSKEENKSNTEN